MRQDIVAILDAHRVLTIATIRPDGWPQATMVGYANDELLIYFLISRQSQKFANMARDNRVSITIGSDAQALSEIRGLSMSALVYPVRDADQQRSGYDRLARRRPELAQLGPPDWDAAVLVRAVPRDVTVLDFSKGLGHAELASVGGLEHAVTMDPARPDDWGPGARTTDGPDATHGRSAD